MKEQLTLEHLAKHLPYELKCIVAGKNIDDYAEPIVPKVFDVIGVSTKEVEIRGIGRIIPDYFILEDVYPILFPLEMLTEPVTIGGKTFTTAEIFEELIEGWCDAYDDWWNFQYPNYEGMMQNAPYEVIKLLLSLHFDIDGLIEKGLAVPVTQDFNPYK